jgi:cathepsin A (carboxypeptidase C)
MKLLASSLLLGAAVAASTPDQQVLRTPETLREQASSILQNPLHELYDALKSLTSEARAVWDEVAMLFPEQMDKASFFSTPKKHSRRPDHEWDHIVKGQEVQDIWVENANGEKEREVGGKLEAYDLRVKAVDPSELGIDPEVKQYSGYLDDNANDKHLFYCTAFISSPSID